MKCFGERPACTRCVRKDEICIYDAAEGVSRQQDLRTRLHSVEAELGQTRSFIHNLQHSSNGDAAVLLTRLRLGEDVAELVNTGERRSARYYCFLPIYQPMILTLQGVRLRHITRMAMTCPLSPRLVSRSEHRHNNPIHHSTIISISPCKISTCYLSRCINLHHLSPTRSLRATHSVQRIHQCAQRRGIASRPQQIRMRGIRDGESSIGTFETL